MNSPIFISYAAPCGKLGRTNGWRNAITAWQQRSKAKLATDFDVTAAQLNNDGVELEKSGKLDLT
jgi:hypothetical protein